MGNLQQIHDIAEICSLKGIDKAVLSPGSRVAPLTFSFARHSKIECYVIPDERSAGYIALGMAQQSKKPIVLSCTSGTAAINYYPAITEAFYQNIPLLILTADRPPELIDQGDGQSIRQEGLFNNHIKRAFTFPIDQRLDDAHDLIQKAIEIAQESPAGPVHVNVPIREPFYPEKDSSLLYSSIKLKNQSKSLNDSVFLKLPTHSKALIVLGQGVPSKALVEILNKLDAPVICESISNLRSLSNAIVSHDLMLDNCNESSYHPDFLITLGDAILSKSLKQFLRTHKPKHHWNFTDLSDSRDVFQSITKTYRNNDIENVDLKNVNNDEINLWINRCKQFQKFTNSTLNVFKWTEFHILHKIVKQLPRQCNIHVSNSMSIRYINHLTFLFGPDQHIFSNRGTSGIDGCTSTAIGASLTSSLPNYLITGDLAFFYDRNALWHPHLPSNLNIILMNNQGGGIFRMINGPADQPELETYFETPHQVTAKNTAGDFGLEYRCIKEEETLNAACKWISEQDNNIKLLEVLTDTVKNTSFYKSFRTSARALNSIA